MSTVVRLTKALEFLQGHAWGTGADRQECPESPDGFSYCAQGAVAYGAFPETGEEQWCELRSRFHMGPCKKDSWGECSNTVQGPIDIEFAATIRLLDEVAGAATKSFGLGLTWYNDAPRRTKDEVIVVFEKAIAKAKEPQA